MPKRTLPTLVERVIGANGNYGGEMFPPFRLTDSKSGSGPAFATTEEVREALCTWIHQQRHAGETVIEYSTGQWSDSRITIWISDSGGEVVRLRE